MDGQLDVHAISQMEQKFEKTRFVRVDSDTIDNLIRKDNVNKVTLNEDEKNALQEMFKASYRRSRRQISLSHSRRWEKTQTRSC